MCQKVVAEQLIATANRQHDHAITDGGAQIVSMGGHKVVGNQGLPTVLTTPKKTNIKRLPRNGHPWMYFDDLYLNATPKTALYQANHVATIAVYVHLCRIHMTDAQLHAPSSAPV